MADWDVATAGSQFDYDTDGEGKDASAVFIDETHFVTFWSGGGNEDGLVQTLQVNTSTWAVTTAYFTTFGFDGSPLYEEGVKNRCYLIDSNHIMTFWQGSSAYDKGYVQTFVVNTSTWAVTTAGSKLEFDTTDFYSNCASEIDSNHYIQFWSGDSGDGYAQVVAINTSTWAVTTAGSQLEYDTSYGGYPNNFMIDDNHFVNIWEGTDLDAFAQVFAVNTSTWAVTTANSSLEFDTQYGYSMCACEVDSNHFICFWGGGSSRYPYAQVLEVNTSTYAVTTAGSSLQIAGNMAIGFAAHKIDDNHFIMFCEFSGQNAGSVYTIEVDTSTWAVTTKDGAYYSSGEAVSYLYVIQCDTSHYVHFWRGDTNYYDSVQVFEVEVVGGAESGNSERNIYIKGLTTSDSERVVYIQGKLTADSERSIYLDADVDDIFSYENASDLESDDATLSNTFVEQDYTDVESDNDIYVCAEGTNAYCKFLFQKYNDGESQSPVSITWKGKSTEAPSSSTVYLQIYNREDTAWENLDSDDSTAENTEFTLSGSQSTDLSDYFDENYVVAFRIYQEVT